MLGRPGRRPNDLAGPGRYARPQGASHLWGNRVGGRSKLTLAHRAARWEGTVRSTAHRAKHRLHLARLCYGIPCLRHSTVGRFRTVLWWWSLTRRRDVAAERNG